MNLDIFRLKRSNVVAYSLELEVVFNKHIEYLNCCFKSEVPYHLIIEFYTNRTIFPIKRCKLGFLKKNLEGVLMIEYIHHNIELIKFDSDWEKTGSVEIKQETFFDLIKKEETLIISNKAEKDLMINFPYYIEEIKTL